MHTPNPAHIETAVHTGKAILAEIHPAPGASEVARKGGANARGRVALVEVEHAVHVAALGRVLRKHVNARRLLEPPAECLVPALQHPHMHHSAHKLSHHAAREHPQLPCR